MITIYRRGKVWWARGSIRGKPTRCSLDTQFKDVAWQRAQELERRTDQGLDGRPRNWAQFESEFLHWIEPHVAVGTWRRYRFIVVRFGKSLAKQGVSSIHSITPFTISNFIGERMNDVHPKRHTKPGHRGLRLDLRVLRRVFNYARDNKYILENPVQTPRLNYVTTQTLPFTDDDLAVMFADPEVQEKPNLRGAMLMLLYTGLRISDVAGMELSSVHFDRERIDVKAKKNGALVSLPLHQDVRGTLIEHLNKRNEAQTKSPLLFPTQAGRFDRSLEAKFRRVWKRSGIQNAHAHRFRDTFAVKLLARGASLYDVAQLLGNSMRVVERHYSPYVKELQDRGSRLVNDLRLLPLPGRSQPIQPRPITVPTWKN